LDQLDAIQPPLNFFILCGANTTVNRESPAARTSYSHTSVSDGAAKWIGLASVLLLLSIVVWPEGVSRSYDWGLHAAWIERFYHQMAAGTAWPQWLHDADGGRGAPVFLFYPPMAYWLASLFRAAFGESVLALELTEAAAVVLLYFSSYRLFKPGNSSAHTSCLALCCCLSPAMLFVAFRVHMVGAMLALAAFPCLLHALRQNSEKYLGRVLELALAFAFIGWTHLPSLLMAGLVTITYASLLALRGKSSARSIASITSAGLGLGLAMALAPIWPALAETESISLGHLAAGNLDWRTNFLFALPAIFEGFRADYPFLMASASCLLVVSILVLWSGARGPRQLSPDSRSSALLALGCLAMTTPLSWPLYAQAWPLQTLQFPWRWLPMATVCSLLAVASLLRSSATPVRWLVGVGSVSTIAFLALPLNMGTVLPQRALTTPTQEDWMISQMPRGAPEYRPRLLQATHDEAELASPTPPPTSLVEGIWIQPRTGSLGRNEWRVEAEQAGAIQFGIACFRGWSAYLNQQRVEIECNERGLLRLSVAAGTHDLLLDFESITDRSVARTISLVAALLWLILFLKHRKTGLP